MTKKKCLQVRNQHITPSLSLHLTYEQRFQVRKDPDSQL